MLTDALISLRRGALASLRPPPRQALSKWLEDGNIILPDGVSSTPGCMRLWPYQRDIADAIGDPTVERVTLVKSVRVGFSTLLTGAIASFVANDPAPILAVLPTEQDARDYVVSDVEPIFDASPTLKGLLSAERDETGRNTLLSRRFPGGSLKVVAAKAPRNLRRHNVRILLIDEVDAIGPNVEGDPITQAERRTLSFADRKIVIGSTPTFENSSRILKSYAVSDRRRFHIPCRHCGAFFEVLWSHIRWPESAPERASCICPSCDRAIEEQHKPESVEAGNWCADAPEVAGHAGFRLNALVSLLPNASWGRLAKEYAEVKDDPERLQVFENTILARGWSGDVGETFSETELAARVEQFGLHGLPDDVLAITVGADVQHDRIEVVFLGWSADGEIFVLGHSIVFGDVHDDSTWLEVNELLGTRWRHPLGGTIGVDAALIDAGDGGTMETVMSFTAPRWQRRVMAGKGAPGTRAFLEASKSKSRLGKLFIVGVDAVKTHLASRLAREKAVRFSSSLPLAWFEQLCSERCVTRYFRGQPTRRWERIPGRRAEALDCVVYAIAARQAVNIDFVDREASLRGEPTKARRPRSISSAWMNR